MGVLSQSIHLVNVQNSAQLLETSLCSPQQPKPLHFSCDRGHTSTKTQSPNTCLRVTATSLLKGEVETWDPFRGAGQNGRHLLRLPSADPYWSHSGVLPSRGSRTGSSQAQGCIRPGSCTGWVCTGSRGFLLLQQTQAEQKAQVHQERCKNNSNYKSQTSESVI